jgi:MFS family permease
MGMTLAGLFGCLYAPMDGLWGWAIVLGLGQGGTFSLALTLIVLRSRDAHVAANLSGMAQGIGYTVASMGPLAVGLVHEVTGGWSALGWIFAVIGLGAIIAGLGAGRCEISSMCKARKSEAIVFLLMQIIVHAFLTRTDPAMSQDHQALITRFYQAFQQLGCEAMAECYTDRRAVQRPGVRRTARARCCGDMWRMLTSRAKDFSLTFDQVQVTQQRGSAHWVATYVFSQTGAHGGQ